MAVRSLKNSGITNFTPDVNSMLAGYSFQDFHHLETVQLGGNATSVVFSNLAQYSTEYRHLQLRVALRSNNAAVWEEARLTFNGSTSGYYSHVIFGYESSPPISTFNDDSSNLRPFFSAVGANAPAGVFGAAVIDIVDAFSTTKTKVARTSGARVPNNSENRISLASGIWNNTNAISSISMVPFGGTAWTAGSRFSLYGIR